MLSLYFILVIAVSAVTLPQNLVGTTLPLLNANSYLRVFNDLQKQSDLFLPYFYQWGWGRIYPSSKFPLLANLYPQNVSFPYAYGASIKLNEGMDDRLLNNIYTLSFQGNGTIAITQLGKGGFNLTLTKGNTLTFKLANTNNNLYVYIYFSDISNPVNNITILPQGITGTFDQTFLDSIKGFQSLRLCYWQGETLWNGYNKTLLYWTDRISPASATQVSSGGIALQHLTELETITGVIPWYCIPQGAQKDFIANMSITLNLNRNPSKLFYLEYSNAYNRQNDVPDTNLIFDLFMQNYGYSYRNNILFVINYPVIQYFLNVLGNASKIVDYTYIDAIGMETSFGYFDATFAYNFTTDQFKNLIIQQQLAQEVLVNQAYQKISVSVNKPLISYSGGPYLKVPQFGWRNNYNKGNGNKSALNLSLQQENLSASLYSFNNDSWVGQLYLDWLRRLQNIGLKTIMFSRLAQPWTDNRLDVPLLEYINQTTPAYTSIIKYLLKGQQSNFASFGVIPSNPFNCVPSCVWGDCINNVCICYQGVTGLVCDNILPSNQDQSILGINLAAIVDYNSQLPFIDMMKMSRAWICNIANGAGGWGGGANNMSQIPFDSNGYPTYLPTGLYLVTIMARDILTHYDRGTYIILFDGDGTLNIGSYDITATRRWVGRIEIDVVPSTNMNNGILITIQRTNPYNYIRNIRVIRPGYQGLFNAVTFHPMFLSKIKPYKTLRFMEWLNTNGQTDVNWVDRTTRSTRTYTINGVALQDIIRLSNTMGKDLWVNIPHLATNDYITQMAILINNTLRPDLKVYVEYSNQVWGLQFAGGQYAQVKGVQLKLNSDPTQARFCYYGWITNNISIIWNGIFGNNTGRLTVLVNTQSVNADTTSRILTCKNTYNYVNAVAIAPYFTSSKANSQSLDQLLNIDLPAQIQIINTTIPNHLRYTKLYNLKLLCYQAGQGLSGGGNALLAQNDIRMVNLYTKYLEVLFNNSISLVNLFSDVTLYSGSYFGIFNFGDQIPSTSVKWNGIAYYLQQQNYTLNNLIYGSMNNSCLNNCSGNGLCYYGVCQCFSNNYGSDCSLSKIVLYLDCGYLCTFNHGSCLLNMTIGLTQYWACSCYAGWKGAYCAIPICTNQCNYNGQCVAPNTCQCYRGRTGVNSSDCSLDCGCNGHGTCGPNLTCLCDIGYTFNSSSKKCEFNCFGLSSNQCYGPYLLNCQSGCFNGNCINGTCSCWNGYFGNDCSIQGISNFGNDYLGINMAGLSYWSTQYPFINFFYQSSSWIPLYYPNYYNSSIQYTWNTGTYVNTQPNGYPAMLNDDQIVVKLLMRDVKFNYPQDGNNSYVLLYDGQGLISLGFDANHISVYAPGRILFTVVPSIVLDNGIQVLILKTNPANPIRNIRIMFLKDEYRYLNELLTDNFKKFLQPFSTIRYTDIMSINSNNLTSWAQATRIDQDTQARNYGISPELLVNIINNSGRDAWISIPHMVTDDYVKQLARYLYLNVVPNRNIYIEYSNEVWNSLFAQYNYAVNQAKLLNLSDSYAFYGLRSLQIFNIFKNITNNNANYKYVISAQAVSTYTAQQIFRANPTLASVANILAIAPYYDCGSISSPQNSAYILANSNNTTDLIFSWCQSNLTILDSMIQNYKNFLTKNNLNLTLTSYESGTSILEQNAIYGAAPTNATALFIAANQDPRMQNIYRSILSKYYNNGLIQNAPNMLFSSIGLPSKYGSWGLLDNTDQINANPTHPKYRAVLNFTANPS